ncbi:hypothetical protein BROUX41_004598 [Berkeleyomyces rouxiae]|uniref:uncharacterized protein n=1 Tax=Berkeleyomyces rouxiae TaxID=2035830 RepID=UPI003B7D7017
MHATSLLAAALLVASSAVAVPTDDVSSTTSSSSYTIIPIYPTTRASTSLQTVIVTETIDLGSSASSSGSTTTTSKDPNSYSVVPIEGLPPATTVTVTVVKSGSSMWTVTPTAAATAPLGSGTGHPLSSTGGPVVVSAASQPHVWPSVSGAALAVAGGVLAVVFHW